MNSRGRHYVLLPGYAMPPVWKGEGDFGIVIDDEGEDDYVVSYQDMNIFESGAS